ncbi:hypothetical protein [Spartinivicinus ruber]|uniref:hypothetical protein n=1 Tax=Spartinivicinus ruber TaxID=2683272 RepID=UPI0013D54D21|nr:hypothetical protein [Spartinivicinus ruber]
MANAAELSKYIVAFAGAARTAQAAMSTGTDPMTIAEYKFEVNITADFQVSSETDVALTIWRLNIKQKLSLDYKTHMGISVTCVIKPAATLVEAG